MKLKHHITFVTLLLLCFASSAQAHHRDFTFLRDWYLPYVGEHEIESRTSVEARTQASQQEFEYEIGIAKHFTIEPGVGFHQEPGEKTHFDEWDVEFRFNFGEFAYNKILPAMNISYESPADGSESKNGRLGLIASFFTREGENYSVNFNVTQQLTNGRAKDSEILFGYSRPFSKRPDSGPDLDGQEERSTIRGGFEFMHNLTTQDEWIGPVAAVRFSKHLNGIFTYLVSTNHKDSSNNQLKFIFEWEF
jgi:hypothetical protein